ncbi:MAG: glycolate oxidase iron-sulfur subunit, partial [Geminicoccaceae bacterium]|nr:glycolate oxidase iron-sulfur subunit [Geminicoccaceae bacterium]
GAGCCGALTHHMGKEHAALASARANIDAWTAEAEQGGLDAVVINASGCGTTVKDYGYMLRTDPAYAEKAERISALTKDVTKLLGDLGDLGAKAPVPLTVAYHSACSLQHGQKITSLPKRLLTEAGFRVEDVPEGHICCGSAGTYNLLQPELADQLKTRKVTAIEMVAPDVVAAGNVGCITQIASGTDVPVVHTVELLDWATGGPRPAALQAGSARERSRAAGDAASDEPAPRTADA